MSEPEFELALLRDARLKPHATGARAAWLWSGDGSRILWANALGAAVLGAASPSELTRRHFDPAQGPAHQIAGLARSLESGGKPRLERVRGIGRAFGATTCSAETVALPDGSAGVLLLALEPIGPDLSLAERGRRLVAQMTAAVATFAADGALLGASPAGSRLLGGARSLAAAGGRDLAAQALRAGNAAGTLAASRVVLERLGGEEEPTLLAVFTEPEAAAGPAGGDVAAPSPRLSEPVAKLWHSLRFVWQIDDSDRFTIVSEEFVRLLGPRTAATLGRSWNEVAATLQLDPAGRVAQAIASRQTWSGITVAWPLDGDGERVDIEISGLPVFDDDRVFRGYRGFAVCRDTARLMALATRRGAAHDTEAADAAEPPPAQPPAEPEPPAATAPPSDVRPLLTVVPQAKNVVPFRPPADARAPSLNPVERKAFRELARQLTARLGDVEDTPESEEFPDASPSTADDAVPAADETGGAERDVAAAPPASDAPTATPLPRRDDALAEQLDLAEPQPADGEPAHRVLRAVLDRVPTGVLVYRLDRLLYANAAFLRWTGHPSLEALAAAGGLESLFVDQARDGDPDRDGKLLTISSNGGGAAVHARLYSIAWYDETALMLTLAAPTGEDDRELAVREAEARRRDLEGILDAASDGIVVLDPEGRVLSANAQAKALFGYDNMVDGDFLDLFAPESHRIALDYLDGLRRNGATRLFNEGREIVGRTRGRELVPLHMSFRRSGEGGQKFCAMFRDITQWKKAEQDLLQAKREAERASAAKSEFLAKISHEIRTPLNAIIGFAEVMMEERFGSVGNERYRQYLKDIHECGGHLISLLNDLLDLSKIEAGKLDLAFTSVNLNDLTQQCVAIMQSQANRERIIIRTALSPPLPQIVADARSVRQIVLNLLSNSIKFTPAGGQVIVSTTLTDAGEVVLRVRDTGIGMNEKELQTALEPFRQVATSTRWGAGGTGLGLPLTKALAQANRAEFGISSAPNTGTLVEITFPPTRVLAE